MEAHIIVSKYIFPYLFLGSSLTQSTMTQLKEYSKAGTGRSGGTRKFWFDFHITRQMLQDQQFLATSGLIFGQQKWANIPLEVSLTPKCSVIDESWARLTTVFFCILPVPLSGRSLYIHHTQSHMAVAIFSSILILSWNSKHFTFSASSTENDLEQGSTSYSFCALISCSLVRRSLLIYLIVGFRTGP
jgi:hypothetical protein